MFFYLSKIAKHYTVQNKVLQQLQFARDSRTQATANLALTSFSNNRSRPAVQGSNSQESMGTRAKNLNEEIDTKQKDYVDLTSTRLGWLKSVFVRGSEAYRVRKELGTTLEKTQSFLQETRNARGANVAKQAEGVKQLSPGQFGVASFFSSFSSSVRGKDRVSPAANSTPAPVDVKPFRNYCSR